MLADIAVVLYVLVAAIALYAARTAPRLPRVGFAQAPWIHWYGVAAILFLLAGWRLLDGEASVQAAARAMAHVTGHYEERRVYQGPIVAFGIVAGGAILLGMARAHAPSAEIRWSRIAVVSLVSYSAVRALSYHPVDALIYASWGVFHINHLIDLGLLAILAGSSLAAVRRHHAIRHRA